MGIIRFQVRSFFSLATPILVVTVACGEQPRNMHPMHSDTGYSLERFDTEEGVFSPELSEAAIDSLMGLWREARDQEGIMNPDEKHGRLCGTHNFLHSKYILRSEVMTDKAVFLVSPGLRPCDFDEVCTRVQEPEDGVCAHTQYMELEPVVVSVEGTLLSGYGVTKRSAGSMVMATEGTRKAVIEAGLVWLRLWCSTCNPLTSISDAEPRSDGGWQVRLAAVGVTIDSPSDTLYFLVSVGQGGRIVASESVKDEESH